MATQIIFSIYLIKMAAILNCSKSGLSRCDFSVVFFCNQLDPLDPIIDVITELGIWVGWIVKQITKGLLSIIVISFLFKFTV